MPRPDSDRQAGAESRARYANGFADGRTGTLSASRHSWPPTTRARAGRSVCFLRRQRIPVKDGTKANLLLACWRWQSLKSSAPIFSTRASGGERQPALQLTPPLAHQAVAAGVNSRDRLVALGLLDALGDEDYE